MVHNCNLNFSPVRLTCFSSILVLHVVCGFLLLGQPVAGLQGGGQPPEGRRGCSSGSHHIFLLLHLHLGVFLFILVGQLKKKKTIILSNAGVDRVTLTGISRKPRLFLIVTTLACKDVCELMRLFSQQVAQTLFSIEKFKNVSFEEEYTKLFPPQPHQPLV